MRSFLLYLLMGSLLGCAAENESMEKFSKERQSLAAKISGSEAQNVLIFNESSAIVAESEGSWDLRVSSFEPVQAIYVDNIPMTLDGRSFDFSQCVVRSGQPTSEYVLRAQSAEGLRRDRPGVEGRGAIP